MASVARRTLLFGFLVAQAGCATAAPSRSAGDDCGDERTQAAMNACYAGSARDAEARMQAVLAQLLATTGQERGGALPQVQGAWSRYRDLQCGYEAERYAGGSLQATIHGSCILSLTEQRIRRLERMLEEANR